MTAEGEVKLRSLLLSHLTSGVRVLKTDCLPAVPLEPQAQQAARKLNHAQQIWASAVKVNPHSLAPDVYLTKGSVH